MNVNRRAGVVVFLVFLAVCALTGAYQLPANSKQQDSPGYIPPACKGKLITAVSRSAALAEPSPEVNPAISATEQIKMFDALAKTINDGYLYPDFNGLNWSNTMADFRQRILSGLATDRFYALMEQFVEKLGDKHSRFDSPAKVAADRIALAGTNNYVGIGAFLQPLLEKQRVTILSVIPDSAAEHAGLQPHDALLTVDGLPLVADGKVFQQRTRGPECSVSVFMVQSPGSSPRQVTLVRYQVVAPVPIFSRLIKTTDGARIGYIFLPSFFDVTIPDQVKKALTDFGQLDGLIIDNRMNTGGSSKVLYPVLGYFVSGRLGYFVSRTGRRPFEISGIAIGNSQTVPMVILVSRNTVSFGEIFSGVLQDLGRAKIVGQTTSGRVETLHGHNFPDGSQAWIAEEGFDPLNSHDNWRRKGITPDVAAYADWDTFSFENDPGVAAAVPLLQKK